MCVHRTAFVPHPFQIGSADASPTMNVVSAPSRDLSVTPEGTLTRFSVLSVPMLPGFDTPSSYRPGKAITVSPLDASVITEASVFRGPTVDPLPSQTAFVPSYESLDAVPPVGSTYHVLASASATAGASRMQNVECRMVNLFMFLNLSNH